MLAFVIRAMARFLPVLGLVFAGLMAQVTRADAFQGFVSSSLPMTSACTLDVFMQGTTAYVAVVNGDQKTYAGGKQFGAEGVIDAPAITVAALEACGLTNVSALAAVPASGTIAEASEMSVSFRATFPSDGKTYDVKASILDAVFTYGDFQKKVVNTAPEVETVGSVLAISGQTVQLQSGAFDAENDNLSYFWEQTGSSGYRVNVDSILSATASFTAPDLPAGSDPVTLTFRVSVSDGTATSTGTVTVTVRASNSAPVVNAGEDQTVESGAKVDLAATAQDPDGDRMSSERWDADYNMLITGSNAYKASFTAPTLDPGAADLVITLTFRVYDPWTSGSDSVTVRVKAPPAPPPANGMPTARITGPETAKEGDVVTLDGSQSTDPEQQALTYIWEQMAGPTVIGRTTDVTSAAFSFTAPDLPEGVESVTLTFKLSVSDGSLRHATTHSVTVTRAGPSVEQTQTLVLSLVQARMDALLSGQVDLSSILSGDGGGSADVVMSSMGGTVDLATAPDAPVWFRLSANWSDLAGAESDYALGSAGTHVKLGDGLALGVMAQVDRIASVDGVAVSKGTGWLVGPYVVARMPEQPLILQGRLLYGATSNRLSPLGTYEDRFDGTRMLAQLGLSGEVVQGDVTWRPNLQASYGRETLDGYVDGLGKTIPGQVSAMSQVAAGLEVSFPIEVQSGAMRATVGLSNIWVNSATGTSALDGYRGKLSVAVKRSFASGGNLSVAGSYDGLGGSALERFGLDLVFEHRF